MFLRALEQISKKLKRVFIFKWLRELGARRKKTHLKRIRCYNKMVQAMIAQKSSEVDTNLQKIGTDMITMFRVAKKEKQTENRLNQDFSQDDNDVKKKTKVAARAPARKRYSTTKIKARNFLTNIPYRRYKKT